MQKPDKSPKPKSADVSNDYVLDTLRPKLGQGQIPRVTQAQLATNRYEGTQASSNPKAAVTKSPNQVRAKPESSHKLARSLITLTGCVVFLAIGAAAKVAGNFVSDSAESASPPADAPPANTNQNPTPAPANSAASIPATSAANVATTIAVTTAPPQTTTAAPTTQENPPAAESLPMPMVYQDPNNPDAWSVTCDGEEHTYTLRTDTDTPEITQLTDQDGQAWNEGNPPPDNPDSILWEQVLQTRVDIDSTSYSVTVRSNCDHLADF